MADAGLRVRIGARARSSPSATAMPTPIAIVMLAIAIGIGIGAVLGPYIVVPANPAASIPTMKATTYPTTVSS